MNEAIDNRAVTQTVVSGLSSNDPVICKEAQDNVTNYIRLRQREEGFFRKLFNVEEITRNQLTKQVDTPLPCIVRDMEPNSAGAYSVPFGTTPLDESLSAPRYRLMFDRIMSYRYVADVNSLLTWDMDIRQIFDDFILKDILGEEDRKGMLTVEATVGSSNGSSAPVYNSLLESRTCNTAGAVSRLSLVHAMKGLPSTNRRLNPAVALVNNIFVWDVVGLERNEVGGDLAEELFVNGFAERTIMGLKWIITIKSDLVKDLTMYIFAAPKYLGNFAVLDNVVMSSKHEDFMLSFYAYESVAAIIANAAAVVKVAFTGSAADWRASV